MIEAGTTLQQRYRIDRQIGQGGMGAVYIATDERFGSTVAIKETLCMDDNFRKAIEREARLLNSLKHSALPRVSDHFLEREGQFLVMEYIQGEDLCCMLDGMGKAFDLAQVLKWADQLLDALDYLHNQIIPVIHRDIKPQNLKITAGGQIILLDFGLAKGNPTDAENKTAAKSIFGYSRNYASLEQIQGTGTDPRSDLYSLAATLYHLMTNVAPEDALTRAMAVLSHKPDPLIPANAINPAIPSGVAGVLQKALDLNANERPVSAVEMKQMFHESEKYAYLAEAATFSAAAAVESGVFAQPTRLMSDSTRADAMNLTDARTGVSPFHSEETSVAPNGQAVGFPTNALAHSTAAPKSRGFAAAAGAFVVLLIGALIAVGLYVVKPSVFGMGQDDENSGPVMPAANTNSQSDAITTAPAANIESAQSGLQGAAAANSVPSTTNENPRQVERTADTAKSSKTPAKSNAGTEEQTFNIAGDPDDPDEVTITQRDRNGTVHVTKIKPKIPPINIPQPPVTEGYDPFPKDPSTLTPAQRRQLQEVWRNRIKPVPPALGQTPN